MCVCVYLVYFCSMPRSFRRPPAHVHYQFRAVDRTIRSFFYLVDTNFATFAEMLITHIPKRHRLTAFRHIYEQGVTEREQWEKILRYMTLDQDFETCLPWLNFLMKERPEERLFWLNERVFFLRCLNRIEEALECVDELIEMQPSMILYRRRADFLMQLERLDECLEAHDLSIEYGSPVVYKARALEEMARWEESVDLYQQFLRSGAHFPPAIWERVIGICIRMEDFEKASAACDECGDVDTCNRGKALIRNKKRQNVSH